MGFSYRGYNVNIDSGAQYEAYKALHHSGFTHEHASKAEVKKRLLSVSNQLPIGAEVKIEKIYHATRGYEPNAKFRSGESAEEETLRLIEHGSFYDPATGKPKEAKWVRVSRARREAGGRTPWEAFEMSEMETKIMTRKTSKTKRRDPETLGADYASAQVDGDHFRDWVYEQMIEADEQERRRPGSTFSTSTREGAEEAAKNMLQQLLWDTRRELDPREILGRDASQTDVREFFKGFEEKLRSPDVRAWLADYVLEIDQDLHGEDVRQHEEEISRARARGNPLPARRLEKSSSDTARTGLYHYGPATFWISGPVGGTWWSTVKFRHQETDLEARSFDEIIEKSKELVDRAPELNELHASGEGQERRMHAPRAAELPWVPPALAAEGITPIMLQVLMYGMGSPASGAIPRPGDSFVYDRDGYTRLQEDGYIVLKRVTPGLSSFGDYYVLTDKGADVLRRVRIEARKIGGVRERPIRRGRRLHASASRPEAESSGHTLRKKIAAFGGSIRFSDRSKLTDPDRRASLPRWAAFIQNIFGHDVSGEGSTQTKAIEAAIATLPPQLRKHFE